MIQNPALKLIVGVSAVSLAGILMYIYYKNKDDEDELDVPKQRNKNIKNSTKSQKEILLRIVVANDKIPLISGRGGANLKMIEDKSGSVIQFKEKDENNQWCEIRGKTDCVNQAKELISKDLNRLPFVNEEMFIPKTAYGKVIGRCGESMQDICRQSLAKVSVDPGNSGKGDASIRFVITGYPEQVELAKKLITEKINEDQKYRLVIEELENRREPRRSPTNSISISSTHSSLTSLAAFVPSKEKLNFDNIEHKPIEVFVSAIASPAKFWLQMIGPQSKQLDELVETMTEYYSKTENKTIHRIAKPYLGQIVAALFKYDEKWYRAEVVAILPNEFNSNDVVLDLYFVDYGDSEYISPSEVFELNTEFLKLRFQAIECYLANIKPIMSQDSELWDQASTQKFEELTHVASWKKLKSVIVAYKDRPRGGNHIRREGSPVPGVELYDNIEGTDVNIAHMLISHGFGNPDYSQQQLTNKTRLGGDSSSSSSYLSEKFEDNLSHDNKSPSTSININGNFISNKNFNGDSKTNVESFIKNEISNGTTHVKEQENKSNSIIS